MTGGAKDEAEGGGPGSFEREKRVGRDAGKKRAGRVLAQSGNSRVPWRERGRLNRNARAETDAGASEEAVASNPAASVCQSRANDLKSLLQARPSLPNESAVAGKSLVKTGRIPIIQRMGESDFRLDPFETEFCQRQAVKNGEPRASG